MGSDVQAIWGHLGIEQDEIVVLSAIYETRDEGHDLLAASLLVGPATTADGWPAWRAAEGFRPKPSEDALRLPGEFAATLEGAIVGRAVLQPADAYRWLRFVLEKGSCPPVGGLPQATASLGIARAPIRVCTHSETTAGDLATWLARPVVGFHFPRAGVEIHAVPGDAWEIEGTKVFSPAIDTLGMSWFEEKKGPPPSGLVIGKFEPRAWLISQMLEREHDLYKVEIGFDPERVEIMDLEVEVEENIGEELVFAEHLRLEDTDLREVQAKVYGQNAAKRSLVIGVALPTLGRGVKRSVRLTHRDGQLLDEWQSFNIVETISINLTFDGAEQAPKTIGETRKQQDLVELLGAVERVRKQYADLRRGGARNRIFQTAADGRAALQGVLERATGELLVVDAFFKDWSLLESLGTPPPRVLIGPDAQAPPTSFEGKVARWTKSYAPFHDRFFLWQGGGVSVGTSAGAVRNRLFRIVRISAAESEALREQFSLWWDDPGFDRL